MYGNACRIEDENGRENKVFVRIRRFLCLPFVFCGSMPDGETGWPESFRSARNEAYLSEMEKEVIHEINKVRTNPKAYANYLKRERRYYRGKIIERPGKRPVRTREGRSALEACIVALEKSGAVGALMPDANLSRAAGLLAVEQTGNGATGHVCADGRTIKDRITYFSGDRYMKMAENISYGGRDARAIVIRFLIDDGIPSRGHRLNLMNPSFTHCGVAMAAHPVYRHVCVIDFAAY
jgi:hypothetical protein